MKNLRNILSMLLFAILLLFTVNAFSETSHPIEDSVITQKVKSKIAMDKLTSAFKVQVTTENGVVKLNGKVNSDSDASNIIQAAESVDGVKDVDTSNLIVKESKHPLTDTAITAKVKSMFIKEKLFGDKDVAATTISVETNNGIVYLTGTADSQEQADNAVVIAKSVSGVKEVESRVEVK